MISAVGQYEHLARFSTSADMRFRDAAILDTTNHLLFSVCPTS